MAVALTLKQVTPRVNPDTMLVKATISGNYVNGVGDALPLTNILDPGALGQIPLLELPSVTPWVTNENLGGYSAGVVRGATLSTFYVKFWSGGGNELASGAYPAAITGGELGFAIPVNPEQS